MRGYGRFALGVCLVALAALVSGGSVWAEEKEKEEAATPFTSDDQPSTMSVPGFVYGPWLNIYAGFGLERGNKSVYKIDGGISPSGEVAAPSGLAISRTRQSLYLTHINIAGGFGVPGVPVGMDFRGVFDIFTGARTGFRLGSMGTTLHYTFYNHKPIAQAVALDLDFYNQSFRQFYSLDILRVRPSYLVGIGLWRFSLTPYVGLPMLFDTNKKNDTLRFSARTLDDWDVKDNFRMGVDYGAPISFNVWRERFMLNFDTTGQTFFIPAHETTIWVMPGVRVNFGIALLLGFQYMVYSTNKDLYEVQRWRLVLQGGLAF